MMINNKIKNQYERRSCVIEKIGSIVGNIVAKKLPKKPLYTEIFSDWKSVVGEKIASKSIPYKIVTQENKKILVLKSEKGSALFLQHSSLKVLKKVNNFLGEIVFSSVKVIQVDTDESL